LRVRETPARESAATLAARRVHLIAGECVRRLGW
jgi:hypothetical protein